MKSMTTGEIANLINASLSGLPDIIISGINRIESAKKNELTFFADDKFLSYLTENNASCIIVPKSFEHKPHENQCYVYSNNPYEDFVTILKFIDSQKPKESHGIDPGAVTGENCSIAESVSVGYGAVIGDNCTIEDNVIIYPNVVIYDNVKIGANTIIHSNTVCCDDTVIGKNCIIYPGVVLGSEGFGYLENKEDGSYDRIPQLGNVVLDDYVEVGANSTIDRAIAGSTYIGKGVKLDNLVQIGHNCEIGENTAIAAQTGISGSVKIGKRNRFGGQAGLAGHLSTADDVVLIAQSGVSKSITKPGVYFGAPAKELGRAFRIEAAIRQLPEALAELHNLKKQVKKLEEKD